MISSRFNGLKRVLCLGAHSDDIEIGCGGTVLHLLQHAPHLEFQWVVFCSNSARAQEAQKSANWFLRKAKRKTILIKSFRDGFLPYQGGQVKDDFEALKRRYDPDLIFTHFRDDLHQDHRLLCELTWNTWRNHLILEYEIPKYDADLCSPNCFVPLTHACAQAKVKALMRFFGTQRSKHWFSEDLFSGVMRVRSVESGSATRFAEAFHCRKWLMEVPQGGLRRRGGTRFEE